MNTLRINPGVYSRATSPAVGYPSLPDLQQLFTLDSLLHLGRIGIRLTKITSQRDSFQLGLCVSSNLDYMLYFAREDFAQKQLLLS
ncbi:MAG: hypothetical protein LBB90_02755 [Tannerella sp.]|jgi:hypothetical protein|nr:hypothetical protein [Tannerella sp.]